MVSEFKDYIPSDWEIKSLEEIVTITGGKRLPKGESLTDIDSGHPYIRVANMKQNGLSTEDILYVPREVANKISRYTVSSGDIYISVAGTLGLVGRVPNVLDGANLTENANRISNIKCEPNFLLYVLKSNLVQGYVNREKTTNAQPKLALTRIKQFAIPIPIEAEQQKIAAILSSVDKAIEKTEQIIEQTEKVKKGLMQELLTKGIRQQKYKNTLIGKIPNDWEITSINEITGSNLLSLNSKTSQSFKFQYIDIASIDKFVIGDTKEYYFKNAPSRAKRIVSKGDIIISNVRPYLMGFAYIFSKDENKVCSTGFTVLTPDKNKVNGKFLFQVIRTKRFVEYLKSKMTGSNYPAVNSKDIQEFVIQLPSLSEQHKISEILECFDEKIETENIKLDRLMALKQGLMQQLLTGKVRVPIDNEVV